jgi:hypothetical protein
MPDGRMALNIDTSKTLAVGDCGLVQNVIADGIIITLPATVVGYDFLIRNGGAKISSNGPVGATSDGSILLTVAPNASDSIYGNAFTAADNKAALNTKATALIGDEIDLVGDGVNGFMMTLVRGVWVRQA